MQSLRCRVLSLVGSTTTCGPKPYNIVGYEEGRTLKTVGSTTIHYIQYNVHETLERPFFIKEFRGLRVSRALDAAESMCDAVDDTVMAKVVVSCAASPE